jgi:hypothetical protein
MLREVETTAKNMLNALYGLGSSVAEMYHSTPDDMKMMLQIDFLKFILYLGASDGEITEDEASFIKEYFEWDLTIPQWHQFINEHNIDVSTFEVPSTMQFFVKKDNAEYSNDHSLGSAIELYITCFKTLGEIFIGTDGEVDSEEVSSLTKYIDAMQKFYEENTIRSNVSKNSPVNQEWAEKLASEKSGRTLPKKSGTSNANIQRNNKYFTVNFLGEKYSVPEDVVTYLHCNADVSKGLLRLLDEASQMVDKYTRLGGQNFFEHMDSILNNLQNSAKEVIADILEKIVEREIYDVDLDTFMQSITVLKDLQDLISAATIKATYEGKRIVNAKNAGINYAYRSAASNITGSGVRIYTSSFTSLMLHSAVERSVLMSQAKKADAQYQKALTQINARSASNFERMCNDILFSEFFPKLPDIYIKFNNNLMATYLTELQLHGQFNLDNIENYNENKSSAMLENIGRSNDKEDLLKQAFLMCPFNIEVYEKALELGFFDVDTFVDAKKIHTGSELDGLLEEKIKSNLKNYDKIKDMVTVLASYKNESETELLRSLYSAELESVEQKYSVFRRMLINQRALDEWIRKNISQQTQNIISTSADTIKNRVHSNIVSIISESNYQMFTEMGLLSAEKIRLKDSDKTELVEINDEIEGKMLFCINSYIEEAVERKKKYDEANEKYKEQVKQKEDALEEKERELTTLGLFALSQKKELKNIISSMKTELYNFKSDNEPKDLQRAFEKMYG